MFFYVFWPHFAENGCIEMIFFFNDIYFSSCIQSSYHSYSYFCHFITIKHSFFRLDCCLSFHRKCSFHQNMSLLYQKSQYQVLCHKMFFLVFGISVYFTAKSRPLILKCKFQGHFKVISRSSQGQMERFFHSLYLWWGWLYSCQIWLFHRKYQVCHPQKYVLTGPESSKWPQCAVGHNCQLH